MRDRKEVVFDDAGRRGRHDPDAARPRRESRQRTGLGHIRENTPSRFTMP